MVPLPFLPFHFWAYEFWLWEKQHRILDADSKHIVKKKKKPNKAYSHPGTLGYSSASSGHLAGNAVPLFSPASCFREMGNMARAVNSVNVGPVPHFICCEVSSWSEAVLPRVLRWWMKHAVSSWMVVLAEALCAGKANLYLELIFIPVRTKHFPFHDGKSPW